ncbi:MAG: GNAT family N-acetyltransferase [Urechidicola sp.]|nr:GNAT family N-acetyltransferase [Urechidicola sp.]
MLIKQNPFTSHTFVSKWMKHFYANHSEVSINFIKNLAFYKASKLPVFINSGKNHTKGISYSTQEVKAPNFKSSTLLIYDVPKYFNNNISNLPKNIKRYRIKQYPGYLTELSKFKNIDDYLQATFSKKSRAKLNRYQKRLEMCFDIRYKMYCGKINREDYDFAFKTFKQLLEKRFTEKQTTNNNLQADEWAFYYDVSYQLILEKKAALFVIYEGKNPIGITLNYLSEDILFHGITTFDIDYSKFHLGKVMLKNLFGWCFENNIKILDFSKGHFTYKTEWMTKKYAFEYHLYVDQSSIISITTGLIIRCFFKFKQFLRDKKVNKNLHQLTYRFSGSKNIADKKLKYRFTEVEKNITDTRLTKVDFNREEYLFMKIIINEFLFLNSEKLNNFELYIINNKEKTYLFKGDKTTKILLIDKQ